MDHRKEGEKIIIERNEMKRPLGRNEHQNELLYSDVLQTLVIIENLQLF